MQKPYLRNGTDIRDNRSISALAARRRSYNYQNGTGSKHRHDFRYLRGVPGIALRSRRTSGDLLA